MRNNRKKKTFMPHKPMATINTVGDRNMAWAGPFPSPNISPTSCVDDIVFFFVQLLQEKQRNYDSRGKGGINKMDDKEGKEMPCASGCCCVGVGFEKVATMR